MNPRRIARGITALLFGLASTAWILHHQAHWHQRGLDAFLAYQTTLFARQPHPIGLLIVSMILALLTVWLYEALAWLVAKMMKQPV